MHASMPTLLTEPGSGQGEVNDNRRCDDYPRSEDEIIEVIAFPGRIGCILDSSPRRGPFVCDIQTHSPLRGDLQLGDRILAVDDEDVQHMSAVDVSRMLGSRSNYERRITVLREPSNDASMEVESSSDWGSESSRADGEGSVGEGPRRPGSGSFSSTGSDSGSFSGSVSESGSRPPSTSKATNCRGPEGSGQRKYRRKRPSYTGQYYH